MDSFFGEQEGNFSLTVKSIRAVLLPQDAHLEKGLFGRASAVRFYRGD